MNIALLARSEAHKSEPSVGEGNSIYTYDLVAGACLMVKNNKTLPYRCRTTPCQSKVIYLKAYPTPWKTKNFVTNKEKARKIRNFIHHSFVRFLLPWEPTSRWGERKTFSFVSCLITLNLLRAFSSFFFLSSILYFFLRVCYQ